MTEVSFPELLKQVAAKQPTPGGGAVASWVGALGGALGQMAARYSIKKKTADDVRAAVGAFIAGQEESVAWLLDAGESDAAAYGEVNRLQKLAEDDAERVEKWDGAVEAAIAAPRSVVEICLAMLKAQRAFAGNCNKWLLSDLAIAAILAEAGARSGAWNVRVNLPLLGDDAGAQEELAAYLESTLGAAAGLVKEIEGLCGVSS